MPLKKECFLNRDFKENLIYIRTSTTEQNPENQLKDCESLKEGLFIDYTLLSDQKTAWKDNIKREGFEKLLFLVKNRKVKNLIVWDLDRLYRNRKKLIAFFQLCKLKNCRVFSYRQPWLNDIARTPPPWNEIIFDLMLQIMGWMGEEESRKKSERIKSAIRIKKGKKVSYKGKTWGRKPISTIKRNKILKLRNQGRSYREIAQEVKISVGAVHKTLSKYSPGLLGHKAEVFG